MGLPINLIKVHYGFGKHQYYLEYSQLFYYTAWVYVECRPYSLLRSSHGLVGLTSNQGLKPSSH